MIGDVPYPRALLLHGICQHAVVLGEQSGVQLGPQGGALGNAAVETAHHARFACQLVYRRSPGFLHAGASEGIPTNVVPDDYDEVWSAVFTKGREVDKQGCKQGEIGWLHKSKWLEKTKFAANSRRIRQGGAWLDPSTGIGAPQRSCFPKALRKG